MSSTMGPIRPIRVLLANSSPLQVHLLRAALKRRPELECRTCLMQSNEILEEMKGGQVDVVLVSPGARCDDDRILSIIRRIRLSRPDIPIVLLYEDGSDNLLMNAVRAGARGLFSFSEAPFRALCKCIERVYEGQVWLSNDQVRSLLDMLAQSPPLRVVNASGADLLTPREEQVVALVAEGLSNREVARELQLSEHTIKKYLFRIFDKLGISTRVELVLYAVSNGKTVGAERLPALA